MTLIGEIQLSFRLLVGSRNIDNVEKIFRPSTLSRNIFKDPQVSLDVNNHKLFSYLIELMEPHISGAEVFRK